jgi:hypothetical protein
MARADFAVIMLNEHLGDNAGDLLVPWATFVGDATTVKNFTVDGTPTGTGYLLIQTYDVQSESHRIVINGKELADTDIRSHPAENTWQTWMDVIEPGVLKTGNNTIQIRRAPGGDNFVISHVAINWRVS